MGPEGVVAADERAREAGVTLGMDRREAEALCPIAVVLARDPGEEARRFEPVVQAVESLMPGVEVADPGLLFVPLDGALRYYGGEEALALRVAKGIEGLASGARLGVADGPFAARWAAALAGDGPNLVADTPAFLASLDVSVLDKAELVDTFRWLGVTTLGDLSRLPREALASRFGLAGLEAHRLASGEDRSIRARVIPSDRWVEARYEEPLTTLDQAGFAARALAARLMAGLRRDGVAPHRVEVTAVASEGTVRTRVWRSADPFSEQALAERVWWQLRAWVEGGVGSALEEDGEAAGLVRLRLDPADLSGGGRQLGLLEDVSAAIETERALARAQALVGPDAVLMAGPQGGRLPVEQVNWRRWGDQPAAPERDPAAPWPGTTPAPAPALVPPEPAPLPVEWEEGMPVRVRLGSRWEPVLNWAGPWRLVGRWWKDEAPADRYQLVTSAGAFLVVVRDGHSFLAGVYD
jgi:protein ImuB